MSKKRPVGAYTRKPTPEEAAKLDEIARVVVDAAVGSGLVDPDQDVEPDQDAATVRADAPADDGQYAIQIDQAMLQQAVANKNARLIAVMVNETAMLEVALETERRTNGELRAQLRALEQVLAEQSA